jgi:hypothetical protein
MFEKGKLIKGSGKLTFISNEKHDIYYAGSVFYKNFLCGDSSVLQIASLFNDVNAVNFNDIRGRFFIHISDKITGFSFFFIDNSGMYNAFRSGNIVSTSFLDLIDVIQPKKQDFNYSGIAEFLDFGFCYNGQTVFSSVNKIKKEVFFISNTDGKILIKDKGLPGIDLKNDLKPVQFFETLNASTKGQTISLDLTGGTDSRLIASYMSYLGADFEFATSGMPGNKDIETAKRISDVLKKPLHITHHNISGLGGDTLLDIFDCIDGQSGTSDYHRNYLLNLDRKQRGVTLQLSGVGGELYKDFWWLQDFPFYKSQKTNFGRLYDLRINSTPFPKTVLGNETLDASKKLKDDTIKSFEKLLKPWNTQSYDSVYYHYKMGTTAPAYLNAASNFFNSYAPLLERDMVSFGYHLNRGLRFFNGFHRREISHYAPALAKFRTSEGISCSDSQSDYLSDFIRYFLEVQKRLAKVLLRKTLYKTFFTENPNNPLLTDKVRCLPHLKYSMDVLKDLQIINPGYDIKSVRAGDIGKVITLGLVLNKIK